ncbi:MAG: TrkH family potassium uptake protein [Polyangiaceae bacterium]|nr:TrkH family potassium uptake protein [Polyangiaceae bacterium]
MNLRTVARLTSHLLFLVAVFQVVPLGIALYDAALRAVFAYGGSVAITGALAGVLRLLGRGADVVHRKDALGVVALTWILLGVVGGLPFLLEGSIPHPVSALFEAVSGFTTTGATVVADVERLTRATNLWRCLTHWIGGMGIVVLFVAVFPHLGVGAKHLFKTEVPGPITEGLRPKIKHTALILWWVYVGMTVLCAGLLMFAGMPLYDAVCHAMSTLGTGGFSTRTASIGYYGSAAVDWIVFAFMILAGLNFGLYYQALRGRPLDLWRNYEVRFYLAANAIIILVVFVGIAGRHPDVWTALRFAAFQTAAVTTTTGFMTEDFDTYPDVARYLLLLAMFMGACAGSTAGGLKASRVFALFKLAWRELRHTIHPNVVIPVRLGGMRVDPQVVSGISVYFTAFLLIFSIAALVLVALGLDLVSASSAVVACLSSIGPGLARVGPSQNYEFVPAAGKLVLVFCMIAGRLEIFALLAVFSPECWRR